MFKLFKKKRHKFHETKSEQVKKYYKAWDDYYTELTRDPDLELEHKEPDGYYGELSDFERATIRNMAFVRLGEYFK